MAITRNPSKNYSKHRDWILAKKKVYALKNKERIAEYHRQYYLDHKIELNSKNKERYNNRKIKNKKQVKQ